MNSPMKKTQNIEDFKKTILCIDKLSINFGGIKALQDVTVKIYDQEILGIVGPNGAGKTTFFNALTGIYNPDQGHVLLEGQDITNKNTIQIVKKGIIRTFQNIRQFDNMTVLENILSAFHHRINYSLWSVIFKTSSYSQEELRYNEEVCNILKMFSMLELKHKLAKNLSYGQRKKLEIIRALAFRPKILLLDEPAAGLNGKETFELQSFLKKIRKTFNLTMIVIEHDMSFVRSICDRLYVFNNGSVMTNGRPQDVLANKEVIKVYLG